MRKHLLPALTYALRGRLKHYLPDNVDDSETAGLSFKI